MTRQSYRGWSIHIDVAVDERGRPRATARVFEPGANPRSPGLSVGGMHSGQTTEDAAAKASKAAEAWIDTQSPRTMA